MLKHDLDGRADLAEYADSELSDRGKALGLLHPDDPESEAARRLRGHVLPDAFRRLHNVTVEDKGTVKLTAHEQQLQENDLMPAAVGEEKVGPPLSGGGALPPPCRQGLDTAEDEGEASATDDDGEGPEPAGSRERAAAGGRLPNDELPLGPATSRVPRLQFNRHNLAIVALTHLICKVRSKQGLSDILESLHLNGELSGHPLFHPAAVAFIPKSARCVMRYARAHFQCTATRALAPPPRGVSGTPARPGRGCPRRRGVKKRGSPRPVRDQDIWLSDGGRAHSRT